MHIRPEEGPESAMHALPVRHPRDRGVEQRRAQDGVVFAAFAGVVFQMSSGTIVARTSAATTASIWPCHGAVGTIRKKSCSALSSCCSRIAGEKQLEEHDLSI